MKRLLGARRSISRGETAQVTPFHPRELRSTESWAPIPDDVAEWMGMRPYYGPAEQQAAS